jgi:hypothetical protein
MCHEADAVRYQIRPAEFELAVDAVCILLDDFTIHESINIAGRRDTSPGCSRTRSGRAAPLFF